MNKRVVFNSFDGTRLEGVFSCPKGKVKAAVLMLHGCPSEKNEDGFYSEAPDYNRKYKQKGGMAEYFFDQGVASFRFDFREHGESERTEKSSNLIISGMINDVESAFHQLKKLLSEDVPVFVAAASFAGGISINWINIYKRQIERLFLLAPLLDFADTIRKHHITCVENGFEFLKADCVSELHNIGYIVYGEKKMNKTFINEAMLMNVENAFSQLKSKATIIHGKEDPIIPYRVSEMFVRTHNPQCELIPVMDAVHGFGIKNDFDWESPESLLNHQKIYNVMIERILNDTHERS